MNLDYLSQQISCNHITQLNNKYNNDNDTLFKRTLNCIETAEPDETDDTFNHYKSYLNNIYISRKSCIYKSTEPDELQWTNVFYNKKIMNDNVNDNANDNINDNMNYNIIFNENTRKKILTRY
jgi:hypothetical protein